jgi:hypothetical protein
MANLAIANSRSANSNAAALFSSDGDNSGVGLTDLTPAVAAPLATFPRVYIRRRIVNRRIMVQVNSR